MKAVWKPHETGSEQPALLAAEGFRDLEKSRQDEGSERGHARDEHDEYQRRIHERPEDLLAHLLLASQIPLELWQHAFQVSRELPYPDEAEIEGRETILVRLESLSHRLPLREAVFERGHQRLEPWTRFDRLEHANGVFQAEVLSE